MGKIIKSKNNYYEVIDIKNKSEFREQVRDFNTDSPSVCCFGEIQIVILEKEKKSTDINTIASVIKGNLVFGECILCTINNNTLFPFNDDFTKLLIKTFDELNTNHHNSENKANQCVACVKLNHENGNTLPLICPKYKTACFMTKDRDELDFTELETFINCHTLEMAFNKCWDNNNLPFLFEEMKDMMNEEDFLSKIRIPMDDEDFLDSSSISSCLKAWDIMVKNGNKELYTLQRY